MIQQSTNQMNKPMYFSFGFQHYSQNGTGSPLIMFQNHKENVNLHTSRPVQSRQSTSLHALKIPDTGSRITVWTPENAAHTDRNG